MSDNATPFEAEPTQATPPQVNFSPLISTIAENDNEDENEWEYEYDATETEIYYVTLDLTTPDALPRHRPATEAPKRARWTNPSYGVQGRMKIGPIAQKVAPTFSVANNGSVASSSTPQLAPKVGSGRNDAGNNGTTETVENRASNGDMTFTNRRSGEVQILDLDTNNPIVLYDGQHYSCQWASNIGTEMLFTQHDPKRLLPRLLRLPDRVDLLAASSARIVAKHVQLKPKAAAPPKRKRARFEDDEDSEEERPLVQVGYKSSEQRKEQARFLSQMIKIKEDKGEEDMVTINVRKRLTAEKWKVEVRNMRREERLRLRDVLERGKAGSYEVEKAKERLEKMDKEDLEDGFVEDPAEEVETQPQTRRRMRGPGVKVRGATQLLGQGGRGGRGRGRGNSGKTNLPRRGRPPKNQQRGGPSSFAVEDRRASVDTSTNDFSEQFSVGTPGGFDSNMPETPRDSEDPMAYGDEEDLYNGETPSAARYSDAQTPDESLEGEESPSQQLFHDMAVQEEDAPGEEDDTQM